MRAVIVKPAGERVRLLNAPDFAAPFALRFLGGEDVNVVEPQPDLPAGSTASPADWRFVEVQSDDATLTGWVAARFLGEPAPQEPAPLIEGVFVRACVRAELEGKQDPARPQISGDYLIAWSLEVSDMSNRAGNPAFQNAGGPFLLDDEDWADYAASLPGGGTGAARDRLIPALHPEAASFIIERDLNAFQAARFPPGADSAPLPTFLNIFHTWLLGPAAAAEIERRLDAETGTDLISTVLDATVSAHQRARREERSKDYLRDGATVETIEGYVRKTGNALTAALSHAFDLMQKHYPEYFTATTPNDEGASEGGAEVVIQISDDDLDALSRVAQSEVGHFDRYGQQQFAGGLAGVVDTIVNRTAHRDFPDSIQAVIDQPKQFSAINPLGSWTRLPAARPEVILVVEAHVNARLRKEPPAIKGSTNFLNPNFSSPKALKSWGNYVVANAVAIYGSIPNKDVHYHGTAPGIGLPRSYAIVRGGARAEFSGSGTPLVEPAAAKIIANPGAAMASSFRNEVVARALAEWDRFSKGAKKEDADPQFQRIGDYWKNLELSYDGRTKLVNKKTGNEYNPAWSSAFMSFVVQLAATAQGLALGFRKSEAHCHYVQEFVAGSRPDPIYRARQPEDYEPAIGDILHFGREYAKSFDFDEARARYSVDSFYPSHSDLVIEVDLPGRKLFTLGGNVRDSVGRKEVRLAADGKLLPREEGGKTFPWIAVLQVIV